MAKTVDIDQLDRLKAQGAPIVDVLPQESYRRGHLPGAVNVPLDASGFDERIQEVAPDKETPVVLYCRDPACKASPAAAHILEDHLGYQDVRHFPEGLVGWRRAGRDLEGAGPKPLHLEDLKGND